MNNLKIKRGDMVKVIAGKDKGKEGKVLQVFIADERVVVEGVNASIKHLRSRQKDQPGQKVQFFAPINISNVQLVCPKCKKSGRVGLVLSKDNKKVRVCKQCKEAIN